MLVHYSEYSWNAFRSFLILLLVLVFYPDSFAQSSKSPAKKPTILVLGTYHMSDNREDVTTAKRQKEIGELVALLKKFGPTKIAIEAIADNQMVSEKYSQYLSGNYQLGRNEIDQIGFRLAKELKHPKVYPIDWRNNFDLMPVIGFANANNQGAIIQKGMAKYAEIDRQLGGLIKTATVLEILRFLNSDKMVEEVDHIMLTTLVHIGKDSNYIGTDVLADWYERNLKIYTNLTRVIESDDERVLVIIGSGHVNLLRRFIQVSEQYSLEKPEKYLK